MEETVDDTVSDKHVSGDGAAGNLLVSAVESAAETLD